MRAFLTRILEVAQKLRQIGMHALHLCMQNLAMARQRISTLTRQYAPVIQNHVRNMWLYILNVCRTGMDLAVKFTRRAISLVISLGTGITAYLRQHIPLFRQILASKLIQFWQFALNVYRFCFARAKWVLGQTKLLIITGYQKSSAQVRHYLPIYLNVLGARLRGAWRGMLVYCRYLLIQATGFTRTVLRVVVNVCVFASRNLQVLAVHSAHAVTFFCRRCAAVARHYFQIILQTSASGLHSTALALNSCVRWCIHVAGKTSSVGAVIALGMLARTAKIFRASLQFVKNLLYFVARALTTFCQVAGRYLGQGSRRLVLSSWVIAARAGERLYQYALLARLHKPIGIFLLLWPTLWALWIAAEGVPDFPVLIIFFCGVVLMRSAGCIINDLVDQDFDAQVSRTRLRPLATGKVASKEALLVASVLLIFAFLLVLQLNRLTIGLSVIGVLLAILYPFTKRYTYMPQFFLGLTFGWAVPMAYAAQTGTVPAMSWILLMATVLWALVYDTMYAMVDRKEDIKLGIKSTAILFEDADRFIIGIIQLLVMLTLLIIGNRLEFNMYYYAGLALASLLFIYQQYLIRERVPAQCFNAFLNNNWFGAIVFGGIWMNYHYG